jgi:hypothetical protein
MDGDGAALYGHACAMGLEGIVSKRRYSHTGRRDRRIAAMGIRALLEQVMIAKVGDLKTFEGKLDAFQEQGFISLIQRDAMKETLAHAALRRLSFARPYIWRFTSFSLVTRTQDAALQICRIGAAFPQHLRRRLQYVQYQRHLISRPTLRLVRADAMTQWREATLAA